MTDMYRNMLQDAEKQSAEKAADNEFNTAPNVYRSMGYGGPTNNLRNFDAQTANQRLKEGGSRNIFGNPTQSAFARKAERGGKALSSAYMEYNIVRAESTPTSGINRRDILEEVMDYRTSFCAIAALLQKPSQDFPLKHGREQSPEIDIPSW